MSALDFVLGFVTVGIDGFFEVDVNFFWNDVTGTGKLHQSDIDYLLDHGDSLFAVEVTGKIGFDIYVNVSIPIPLIGPIVLNLYTFTRSITLFDFTIGKVTGHIELADVVSPGVLELNMGPFASQRLFANTDDRNEVFNLYSLGMGTSGENILVNFGSYYEEFTNIQEVVGYAGRGDSAIYAGTTAGSQPVTLVDGTNLGTINLRPLQYAVVDFYGGDGNVVLQAGASYNTAWGRSRLQGGSDTSYLDASESSDSVDLITGTAQTTVEGSTSGGDNILVKSGSDLLFGITAPTTPSISPTALARIALASRSARVIPSVSTAPPPPS